MGGYIKQVKRVAVIGSSGAIGSAFIRELCGLGPSVVVYACSRQPDRSSHLPNVIPLKIDFLNEASVRSCVAEIASQGQLDLVLVATGLLHEGDLQPEKSLKALSQDRLLRVLEVNTVGPALVAKHFLPLLNKQSRSVFAALSARVGSVSDNRLGGWYGYRASKAALNMILKCAAIEMGRQNPQIIVVGLHPGTVDSALSKPFQKRVPYKKLFTPQFSAQSLLLVVDGLNPNDSGKVFDWDGQEVEP